MMGFYLKKKLIKNKKIILNRKTATITTVSVFLNPSIMIVMDGVIANM